VIDFVIPGLVLRDSVLGVRLSFEPGRYRPHLLRVAGNADVLGGDVEDIARGQLRVGQDGRRLLGSRVCARNRKARARATCIGQSYYGDPKDRASDNSEAVCGG
jgi:hypothetical protein